MSVGRRLMASCLKSTNAVLQRRPYVTITPGVARKPEATVFAQTADMESGFASFNENIAEKWELAADDPKVVINTWDEKLPIEVHGKTNQIPSDRQANGGQWKGVMAIVGKNPIGTVRPEVPHSITQGLVKESGGLDSQTVHTIQKRTFASKSGQSNSGQSGSGAGSSKGGSGNASSSGASQQNSSTRQSNQSGSGQSGTESIGSKQTTASGQSGSANKGRPTGSTTGSGQSSSGQSGSGQQSKGSQSNTGSGQSNKGQSSGNQASTGSGQSASNRGHSGSGQSGQKRGFSTYTPLYIKSDGTEETAVGEGASGGRWNIGDTDYAKPTSKQPEGQDELDQTKSYRQRYAGPVGGSRLSEEEGRSPPHQAQQMQYQNMQGQQNQPWQSGAMGQRPQGQQQQPQNFGQGQRH